MRYAMALAAAVWIAAAASGAEPVSVSNREPQALEVGYLPADGATPAANPPAMAWLPEPNAIAYFVELSQDPAFPPGATLRIARTPYCLYTHTEPLAPGRWHWRYGFWTREGQRSGRSVTRSFVVTPQAAVFPRPSMEFVRSKLLAEHPRLFMRPEQVESLRRAAQGDLHDRWLKLKARADRYLTKELTPEPPPWTDGKWNAPEWRANYAAVVSACDAAETMAFAYLISGDERYARRTREWLLHIASWDPAGSTSIKVNDEAGMPILHVTSRAYDWIYDALSDDDRRIMREMIRARGEEAYRRLHGRPYEQRAYDSHAGRMWHFLGEAAIAYHGEVPEADRWLEYATTIFWGWYPIWADADGGWAEGMAYWTSYINRVTWWLDALKATTGVDGTRKPFFSKVGDFPLYFAAPHAPISGFGDMAERAAPSSAGRVANYFADAVGNPHWKWLAEEWGAAAHEDSPIGFLRAARSPVAAQAPDDLPGAKLFRGTGLVAMHSDLAHPADDVQLMFRSSPFGNISHSHADQNAIVLGAYGEPLLVNTGIRPWYGSPFCKEYYWATLSHNCVLVNGEGQPRTAEARGRVTAFAQDGRFIYAAGDASAAYPNARAVTRRIMFVRPDTFVLHDRVAGGEPAAAQWLAHGRAPFAVLADANQVTLEHGKAKMRITFVAPQGMRFAQTDRYPLQPESGKTVPEWHLTAETAEPARMVDIVTVIEVARADGDWPITRLERTPGDPCSVRIMRGKEAITVSFADTGGAVRIGGRSLTADAAAEIRTPDGRPIAQFAADRQAAAVE
jgi:hypothetical protein